MTEGTPAELVRLLASDPAGPSQVFVDRDINDFLSLEGGHVKLAAALALDTMAANEAMVSKKIRTLDLQTDGPAVAAALRESAALLRVQVAAEQDAAEGGDFQITSCLGTSAWLTT